MKTVRELLEELEDLVDHHGMFVMDLPVTIGSEHGPPRVRTGMGSKNHVVVNANWLLR